MSLTVQPFGFLSATAGQVAWPGQQFTITDSGELDEQIDAILADLLGPVYSDAWGSPASESPEAGMYAAHEIITGSYGDGFTDKMILCFADEPGPWRDDTAPTTVTLDSATGPFTLHTNWLGGEGTRETASQYAPFTIQQLASDIANSGWHFISGDTFRTGDAPHDTIAADLANPSPVSDFYADAGGWGAVLSRILGTYQQWSGFGDDQSGFVAVERTANFEPDYEQPCPYSNATMERIIGTYQQYSSDYIALLVDLSGSYASGTTASEVFRQVLNAIFTTALGGGSGWGTPISASGGAGGEYQCDTSYGPWFQQATVAGFSSGTIYGYQFQTLGSGNPWLASPTGLVQYTGAVNTSNTAGAWVTGSASIQQTQVAVFGLDIDGINAEGVPLDTDVWEIGAPLGAVGFQVQTPGTNALYLFGQGWVNGYEDAILSGQIATNDYVDFAWSSSGGVVDAPGPERFPFYRVTNPLERSGLLAGSLNRYNVWIAGSVVGGSNPVPQLEAEGNVIFTEPVDNDFPLAGEEGFMWLPDVLSDGMVAVAVAADWYETQTQYPATDPPGIDTTWDASVDFTAGWTAYVVYPMTRYVY